MVQARHVLGRRFPGYAACRRKNECSIRSREFVRRLHDKSAGTVVAVRDETATARTITLEVPDWPGHLAGQHVDVRLTASDGYSAARSYSIANAPNSEICVELTVERLPNGEVSPYLTQELAVGNQMEIRGPVG